MNPGRRVVVEAYGETPLDAVDNHLRIEAQAPPDVARLGARDVVVEVKAAGVGWVDLIMAAGLYQHLAKPPYVPGLEYAGVVAWTGPAVTRVKVGDPVMGDGMIAGPRSLGPYQGQGGFASWAVAPEEAVRPLPAGWTYDQGCSLLGSYETAYHCLVARGRLQAGETVLILGASGSTGLAAVHVAKRVGATVIATGRSPAKLGIVKEQGADRVIRAVAEDGEVTRFRDEVKALTGGRGADVVYDGVGGPSSLEALRCVRFGARFLIVGWAATPFVAEAQGRRGAPNANVLPTNLILMKGLDVLGCPTAITHAFEPHLRAERLERILGWVADGLVPYVDATYAMDDFREAMRAKWESRHVGAVVLRP